MCQSRAVHITLQSYAPESHDTRQLDVQARIAGPTDGLDYRWYTVTGELEPQNSQSPGTVFRSRGLGQGAHDAGGVANGIGSLKGRSMCRRC